MPRPKFPPVERRIVLREVVSGRVWIERPAVVVATSASELVVACPAGSVMKFPVGLDDRHAYLSLWKRGEWQLGTRVFHPPTVFRIFGHDREFDVWFWFDSSGAVGGWYVNLQAPIRIQNDVILTTDWILDLWVSADLRSVTLKDEDELSRAVSMGVLSVEKGAELRRTAGEISHAVLNGRAPWDLCWPAHLTERLERP